MKISICETILADSMGEGWRDNVEAANAFGKYMSSRLEEEVREAYPDAEIEVGYVVQRESGFAGPSLAVDVEDEDFDSQCTTYNNLQSWLQYSIERLWINFCGEGYAEFGL